MSRRSLNILTFNVRSLVDTSRRLDLLDILFYNKIDIAFIQECHLRGHNNNIKLNGYNFIYDNSPIGVAIVIKGSISYSRYMIDDLGFHGTFVKIEMLIDNVRKQILVGSVYIPCEFGGMRVYSGLSKLLSAASGFDGMLIGGDLNAKNPAWGDHLANGNGRALLNWLQDHTLEVTRLSDSRPSYPNSSSYLDHFLVSSNLVIQDNPNFKISSLATFSDHFPIKLELKFNAVDFLLRPPRLYTCFKNTNWQAFRRDMEVATFSIMPTETRNLKNEEIDQLLEEFTSICTSISDIHSEKITLKNHKIHVSDKIKKFFRIKHRWQKNLKKMYHRAGNRLGNDYITLSKQIQLLKIIIKELVNIEQAEKFSQRLVNIKPGPSAFREVYGMMGNKKNTFLRQTYSG